jgi:hypothetical protein
MNIYINANFLSGENRNLADIMEEAGKILFEKRKREK